MTSTMPFSAERRPSTMFTQIGKNTISAQMMTFGWIPNPNQMISSGAIAKIGMTCDAITSG